MHERAEQGGSPVGDVFMGHEVLEEGLQAQLSVLQELGLIVVFEPALRRKRQSESREHLLQLETAERFGDTMNSMSNITTATSYWPCRWVWRSQYSVWTRPSSRPESSSPEPYRPAAHSLSIQSSANKLTWYSESEVRNTYQTDLQCLHKITVCLCFRLSYLITLYILIWALKSWNDIRMN